MPPCCWCGALAVFYLLGKQDLWLRVLALIALLAAAVALFFTSESGKQLIAFGRDSVREVKKVVWPTRKEAMQMTGYVFAFVFVMALVPVGHRQDAGMGAVRPGPGLETLNGGLSHDD